LVDREQSGGQGRRVVDLDGRNLAQLLDRVQAVKRRRELPVKARSPLGDLVGNRYVGGDVRVRAGGHGSAGGVAHRTLHQLDGLLRLHGLAATARAVASALAPCVIQRGGMPAGGSVGRGHSPVVQRRRSCAAGVRDVKTGAKPHGHDDVAAAPGVRPGRGRCALGRPTDEGAGPGVDGDLAPGAGQNCAARSAAGAGHDGEHIAVAGQGGASTDELGVQQAISRVEVAVDHCAFSGGERRGGDLAEGARSVDEGRGGGGGGDVVPVDGDELQTGAKGSTLWSGAVNASHERAQGAREGIAERDSYLAPRGVRYRSRRRRCRHQMRRSRCGLGEMVCRSGCPRRLDRGRRRSDSWLPRDELAA
jgi:hypothetical protein